LHSETVSIMVRTLFRRKPYEAAVVRVRQTLEELAPEIFRDPDFGAQRFEPSEFTKVYRQLALENHPDRGGDPQVMRVMNELRQAHQADIKRWNSIR